MDLATYTETLLPEKKEDKYNLLKKHNCKEAIIRDFMKSEGNWIRGTFIFLPKNFEEYLFMSPDLDITNLTQEQIRKESSKLYYSFLDKIAIRSDPPASARQISLMEKLQELSRKK